RVRLSDEHRPQLAGSAALHRLSSAHGQAQRLDPLGLEAGRRRVPLGRGVGRRCAQKIPEGLEVAKAVLPDCGAAEGLSVPRALKNTRRDAAASLLYDMLAVAVLPARTYGTQRMRVREASAAISSTTAETGNHHAGSRRSRTCRQQTPGNHNR